MNILFIAYACEPESISESFLAYETVCGIAEKVDGKVHVLTRSNNLDACMNDQRARDLGIVWYGCDGGRLMLWLKRHVPLFSIQVYAVYWQFLAARMARGLAKINPYDVVHGLSMMSLHNFTAGLTGLPAIIGPVGGAQKIPRSCRCYGDWIQEVIRGVSIRMTPWIPRWKKSVRSARRIICANKETFEYFLRQQVPDERLCIRQPGYPGISSTGDSNSSTASFVNEKAPDVLKLFWGGRLVRCKGLGVLFDAVVAARDAGLKVNVHVTGDGPDRAAFYRRAENLGITGLVEFHGWLPVEEMRNLRASCHLLTFTSLRETTGLALIEMLLSKRPVAVMDCGGPTAIIDGLECFSISPDQAIDGLVSAMKHVRDDYSDVLASAYSTALVAEPRFDWDAYIADLIMYYDQMRAEK
jgi:glycosyltransferase involved in cell wall biosynthesis